MTTSAPSIVDILGVVGAPVEELVITLGREPDRSSKANSRPGAGAKPKLVDLDDSLVSLDSLLSDDDSLVSQEDLLDREDPTSVVTTMKPDPSRKWGLRPKMRVLFACPRLHRALEGNSSLLPCVRFRSSVVPAGEGGAAINANAVHKVYEEVKYPDLENLRSASRTTTSSREGDGWSEHASCSLPGGRVAWLARFHDEQTKWLCDGDAALSWPEFVRLRTFRRTDSTTAIFEFDFYPCSFYLDVEGPDAAFSQMQLEVDVLWDEMLVPGSLNSAVPGSAVSVSTSDTSRVVPGTSSVPEAASMALESSEGNSSGGQYEAPAGAGVVALTEGEDLPVGGVSSEDLSSDPSSTVVSATSSTASLTLTGLPPKKPPNRFARISSEKYAQGYADFDTIRQEKHLLKTMSVEGILPGAAATSAPATQQPSAAAAATTGVVAQMNPAPVKEQNEQDRHQTAQQAKAPPPAAEQAVVGASNGAINKGAEGSTSSAVSRSPAVSWDTTGSYDSLEARAYLLRKMRCLQQLGYKLDVHTLECQRRILKWVQAHGGGGGEGEGDTSAAGVARETKEEERADRSGLLGNTGAALGVVEGA